MKVEINMDAFKGLTQYNGQKATQVFNKDGSPSVGKSGNTKLFTLTSGGGVYLEESQYKKVG